MNAINGIFMYAITDGNGILAIVKSDDLHFYKHPTGAWVLMTLRRKVL